MKAKIERIILQTVGAEDSRFGDEEHWLTKTTEAAIEIAKLCEQECGEARLADGRIQSEQATENLRALQAHHETELATAQGRVSDLDSLLDGADTVIADLKEDVAASEAKVAVMAEVAERYIKRITSGAHPACRATEEAENRLKQALSAAPKVLYSYKAKVDLNYINQPQTHFIPTVSKESGRYPMGVVNVLGVTGEYGERDQIVSVIVLADDKPQEGDNAESPTSG